MWSIEAAPKNTMLVMPQDHTTKLFEKEWLLEQSLFELFGKAPNRLRKTCPRNHETLEVFRFARILGMDEFTKKRNTF